MCGLGVNLDAVFFQLFLYFVTHGQIVEDYILADAKQFYTAGVIGLIVIHAPLIVEVFAVYIRGVRERDVDCVRDFVVFRFQVNTLPI